VLQDPERLVLATHWTHRAALRAAHHANAVSIAHSVTGVAWDVVLDPASRRGQRAERRLRRQLGLPEN